MQSPPDRSSCAQQPWTVIGIANTAAEPASVAHEILDLFAEVTATDHDIPNALIRNQPELMGDEGFACHVQQRLGHACRGRAQSSSQPTREQGNGWSIFIAQMCVHQQLAPSMIDTSPRGYSFLAT